MMAFATMLVPAASAAGMTVPDDPEDFNADEFPHFHVFCVLQLGKPMRTPGECWENAKVIAGIPGDLICHITVGGCVDRGFVL